MKEYDGKLYGPKATPASNESEIIFELDEGEDANASHPALGGGKKYSTNLPYATIGPSSKFTPDDNISDFQEVKETTFDLTEAYLAPTAPANAEILINEATTSGITNENGQFGLFYDDSATFIKQFSKKSKMQVVQNSELLKPERYSDKTGENTKLTEFVTPTPPASARKVEDYYYTKAEAISSNGTDTAPVDVTYDGKFDFVNGTGIENDTVNITETFTNTVKTGSLIISKKLKGNLNAYDTYNYTFQISFSNVFGNGEVSSTPYSGDYILIKEDGTEVPGTTTNGEITLHPKEKVKISGIPVGTSYEIKEIVNSSDNTDKTIVSEISTVYNATAGNKEITSPTYKETKDEVGITIDKENRTITGVIPCSIVNKLYGKKTAEYQEVNVNISYLNQFGSLAITKKVSGNLNQVSGYDEAKEYKFLVKVKKNGSDTAYNGSYKVNTYTYPNGHNNPPVVTTEEKNAFDTGGYLVIKQGQDAEICEISLTDEEQYEIQEVLQNTDPFYVESIEVIKGEAKTDSLSLKDASITTAVMNKQNPVFSVEYKNRYVDSYIEIDKYVDALYYGEKEFSDNISYQDLTRAKQSFLFTVKQYETLAKAETGGDDYTSSFDVVLSVGNDTAVLDPKKNFTVDGKDKAFSYQLSQKIHVLGNRYYRIEEDTGWSWKYLLKGAKAANPPTLSFAADADLPGYVTSINDTDVEVVKDGDVIKAVILKSYLDKDALPAAEFYNILDPAMDDVEGDTDRAVNKIEIKE